MSVIHDLLHQIPLLENAFDEQQQVIREVWRHAEEILEVDETVAPQFRVTLNPLPERIVGFQNNIFSSLFLAVLQPMGVSEGRRLLYGKLNHLFRTWVTAGDNLLDGEDKVVFDVQMPGRGAVMRQVVVIMLADRILHRILVEAQAQGIITPQEARRLADESLRVLLPSAAEEASEEGGLAEWPQPQVVLELLHPLKTGVLFRIPFLGPEKIERGIDPAQLEAFKRAVLDFGIGCQMLDDIRDMSRDFLQRRANYVISSIVHGKDGPSAEARLRDETKAGDLDRRLDHCFPDETSAVCTAATRQIERALNELDELGVHGCAVVAPLFTAILVTRLDLAHLVPGLAG